MHLVLFAVVVTSALFAGNLICSEIGRRIGVARLARHPEGLAAGAGAVEGAVFALLGLLVAFTFSGAAERFERRKHLITEEANAIGTAWLRLDLLPGDAQPELRANFRKYLEIRAVTYRDASNRVLTQARLEEGASLQKAIWSGATTACRRPEAPTQAGMLLLPALNEMIDITATRDMASWNHPPLILFLLMGGLSLIGALLLGYATSVNRHRTWFHTLVFASILSVTVYVIVDLEFPRLGLIRVDAADQVLLDLRKIME